MSNNYFEWAAARYRDHAKMARSARHGLADSPPTEKSSPRQASGQEVVRTANRKNGIP